MKNLILIILSLAFASPGQLLFSQGWSIDVTADKYDGTEIYLAYYLGSSQYVLDTAHEDRGHYVFSGDDTLTAGVFIVVFPPDNQFFQIMIGEGERDISIHVSMDNILRPSRIEGSPETILFYEYVDFIYARRILSDSLRAITENADDALKQDIGMQLESVDADVRAYQNSILQTHPESLTAILIRANLETEIPEFEGSEQEVQLRKYYFVRDHYFDLLPMRDARLVRTPVLHQKIDYFLNKLTPQVPDSISQSLDLILSHFDTTSEAFKIYLVHFLNHYAKSNIVGMDAVYVHLVENYYANGLATWTDPDQLNKIIRNAGTLKPLLIGKTAPDLLMLTRDSIPLRLSSVNAQYTVLLFWDPDCGHCKKSLPHVVEFYKNYKPRGVEIFSVCTKLQNEVPKCWEAIDEHQMGEWINVVDPYLRSRFKQIYDIRTTPQVYILDKDKKILMKKIAAEQLPQVMERLMENGS